MAMLREVTADVMRFVMRILEFIGATSVVQVFTGWQIPVVLFVGLLLLVCIRWTARWARH